MNSKRSKNNRAAWRVTAVLIILSAIPVIGGAVRIFQLAGGAAVTPENARFFAAPLPVVIHIVSVSLYAVLGAFQFVPKLRRPKSSWHRYVGRLLVPCGLAAALSGLWMTQFYPWPEGDGVILYVMRLLFGSAMLASISLGVNAIWQRDFVAHGNWMLRGYAIGMGAGTQVFTHIPLFLLGNTADELPRALAMGAGWVINILIAEWVIRKRRPRRKRTPSLSL